MEFITKFFATFISSSWNRPLDFTIAFVVLVGSYVYVYILRPERIIPPNPFETQTLLRQIYDSQDVRFITMTMFITLAYVVLRVLYEMGLT